MSRATTKSVPYHPGQSGAYQEACKTLWTRSRRTAVRLER